MKSFIVLCLLVVVVAVATHPEAYATTETSDLQEPEPPAKAVQLGKTEGNAGKARVYDPCYFNPYDHNGCSAACWNVGYYNGGFCSGYDCYCIL